MTIELTGTVKGTVRTHTDETLKACWENALLVLPDAVGGVVETTPARARGLAAAAFPTLVFAHGSSGISDAIRSFARFIASTCGWAVAVPDSMQTKDRITYVSPVARSEYEAVHAMRSSELAYAVKALCREPWSNGLYAVAGTSEGGVAAARFDASGLPGRELAKLIFSWSCEDNYHVQAPRSVLPDDLPVLNVMSLTDKYFSRANPYLDNDRALGHAGKALENNPNAAILLIPQAPHTLLNLPVVRDAAASFLKRAAAEGAAA